MKKKIDLLIKNVPPSFFRKNKHLTFWQYLFDLPITIQGIYLKHTHCQDYYTSHFSIFDIFSGISILISLLPFTRPHTPQAWLKTSAHIQDTSYSLMKWTIAWTTETAVLELQYAGIPLEQTTILIKSHLQIHSVWLHRHSVWSVDMAAPFKQD